MEADLNKPISRPSFFTSAEMSPRIGSFDVTDIKRNLYEDFSCTTDISQRESLESRERVYVCLRIRPFMQSNEEIESQGCISVLDLTSIILKAPKSSVVFRLSEKNLGQMVQKFTFSQVFGPETTQEEFFEGTMKQLVQDFLRGHSRLVFTYGVTNSGKTYTYQGSEDDVGILPRALDMLFKNIQGKMYPKMDFKPHRCRDHRKLSEEEVRDEMILKNSLLRLVKEVEHQTGMNGNDNRTSDNSEAPSEVDQPSRAEANSVKFSVWVSFCEIYNECIYDLLLPMTNDKRRRMLRLAQDIKGCSYVKDLQWIQVSDAKEALKLMKLGLKNQSFASTKLNANSSRSHSIFSVKMLKIDSEGTHVVQVTELFLCDLAGSERCTRTHNEGERLKESGNINASLLILGKCINALRTSQQSKLQQHIPFRESKLTHFFQGFFSGKGKVCMIVNISPSASTYDETLNVLKFSAIAQKVIVLDSSNSSQEQSCDQRSIKEELETDMEADVCLPLKRSTILWEKTLEDVIEDEEDLAVASSGVQEMHCMEKNILKGTEPEVMEETLSPAADEEEDVIIKQEEYQKLLNIIEALKNKLINEKKEKLFMELRIREEVAQEYAQHFAENEKNLKTLFARKQESMEDSFEKRMQSYKDLVKERVFLANNGGGAAEESLSDEQDTSQGDEARDLGSSTDFFCMVESLQFNVSDIKQLAEMLMGLLNALEDPPQIIERLEKKLTEVTTELSKIQGELLSRNEGSLNYNSKDAIETKKPEEIQLCPFEEEKEMVELEEKTKILEIQFALGEELEKEKSKGEGLAKELASLSQALSSSEDQASSLRKELHQQQASNDEITSELTDLKHLNKEQEEKIEALLKKLEAVSQITAGKKSKIKAVEVKIDELSRLGSNGPIVEADLSNWKEEMELSTDGNEGIRVLGRKSSFHCSIESIWEVSKRIIAVSSQKSSQIEDLQQLVEQLQKRTMDLEGEKSLLSDALSQTEESLKGKEDLLGQLQHENAVYSEKYRTEEKKGLDYLDQIKNLDDLLKQCKAKEANIAALEQALKEKASTVLVAEREVCELQGKLAVSEAKIKNLNDQELQLKKEIQELKNNMRTVELLEKGREDSKQAMVQLKKDLLESTAFSSHLQVEVQRKEEEYTDLKDKLADAKKQIEQVQREVCAMRTEEKLLRNRVSELEKSKNQLTEELEIKQRTIQQFKKEELNKKLEDILQQYQKACKDLCSKEKIIEDMKLTLEEQEQTQLEQDQVLEARINDSERLVVELEGWKKRFRELEKQSSDSGQQSANAECEKAAGPPSKELERLKEKLKECEEKHQMDRKNWLREKMDLIAQAKEAETHRNREMKRFAGDREHHVKQLVEAEKLVTEKENDLQKWRAERDQLVAALEVQLSSLISSNAQKDAKIEELKKTALEASTQDHETTLKELKRQLAERDNIIQELRQSCVNSKNKMLPILVEAEANKVENLYTCKELKAKQIESVNCGHIEDANLPLQSSSRASSVENIQDQSETILDSCEVSSENDKTSRFPKPEMEIHFTPLQPNKIEVKHQGSPSTVTIKVPKARKRKSSAMNEEDVKNENEKNAEFPGNGLTNRQKKKTDPSLMKNYYSLRSKPLAASVTSPGHKVGSLQKFGFFLQTSPTVIHSKAKKLMATIKSPKSTEEESVKENDPKPKRAKRRLYSTDISSPIEFSGHVIVMDQKDSDHDIIKRRLRTKRT